MPTDSTTWSAVQTSAQYRAIAWLRWRIFLNNFRRKGSTGDLIARILILPFAIVILIGPTIGAGFGAWYFAHTGDLDHIAWILWGAFAFCQFLNLQLGQPGTVFDPTQLIRFPLPVSRYTAVRLFFGVLSPANISAFCIALSIAIGVTIALPGLWVYAFVALFIFAAANVLFNRMVFAWIDRWLSTRRAREIFTAFIFIFALGVQWVNFTFNPSFNRHRHHHTAAEAASVASAQHNLDAVMHIYDKVWPWLTGFPPNLTASALNNAHNANALHALADILFCALFALGFYIVFAWRTHTEYRGENFSDQANGVAKRTLAPAARAGTLAPALASNTAAPPSRYAPLLGIFSKEFLTVRRNTGIFYGILAPLILVFLFAFKMAARSHAPWLFPAAMAYALIGITPLFYNVFGLEGAGCQFYFMSPVRMRDVFLAKNLLSLSLAAIDILLAYFVIAYVAAVPSLRMTLAGLLWAAAILLVSMTIGNRRSITSAKKVEAGRSASKQASPMSSLISFALLIAGAGVGAGLYLAETRLHINWILIPVLAILAAAAWIFYRSGLDSIDRYAFENREQLFAELCKQ
jgi:ABC-2 type transport system permease protein